MKNLPESLFLCYDNSPNYCKMGKCNNRTTFFAWCNNSAIVKSGFYGCVTIKLLLRK